MKFTPNRIPSTIPEIWGQPEKITTASTMLAIAEMSMATQPEFGRVSKAKKVSNAPCSTKIRPANRVSETAPAAGLKSRKTPTAMEASEKRSAPKNGPAPTIEKEKARLKTPNRSNDQPTNNV